MNNQHLIKFKNPVLLKDEPGKGKPSLFDLPPQAHTYGKKVQDDPEPMKYVVNGWKQAENSAKPASKIKNYQELNRQAIQDKVLTAKAQQQFRKTKDLMVETRQGQKVIPIMLPAQQFSYGAPNRPSTPMKLVMGNCYALQAQLDKAGEYQNQTQKVQSQLGSKISGKTTKSQALREQQARKEKQYRNKPNIKEEFKLNKFTSSNVTKVDTRLKK